MNEYMQSMLVRLKQEQDSEAKQVASWKAVTAIAEKTMKERAIVINLLESNKKETYA